jgi:hypothetical protein
MAAPAVTGTASIGAVSVRLGAIGQVVAVQGSAQLSAVAILGEKEILEAMLPASEPGKIIGWDSTGTALVNVDVATFLDTIAATSPPTSRYWVDRSEV